MWDIIANRRRIGYWTKARMFAISLRESGLTWTVLLGAYYVSSMAAERTFARLQNMKLASGLPGTSSLQMNREVWENWDWTAGGEEWTPSLEWKESIVRNVLRRWIPENRNILEIGPGAGRWTEILLPMSRHFWGVDISERCIAICRERFSFSSEAEFYVSGGSDLAGVPDASIDALWSYDVFVHINQREFDAYVSDFLRVMRPGAIGVIQHGKSGGKHGGWRSDLSVESVARSLTDNGFEIVQQFESWKEAGSDRPVGLYEDVVTVFQR
jgi:ubiquinone/menaquinone biosynthesis C-methylase UbiE